MATHPSFIKQVGIITRHNLAAELSSKERLLSPLLFALTILVLFSFAIGEPLPDQIPQMLVAEVFLCLFITLQLVFSRILEPDQEDQFFEVLRTYPVSAAAIFWSKFLTALLYSVAIMIPVILFSCLLLGIKTMVATFIPLFLTSLLAMAGLIPLGIILALITSGANARQILYPILYFPLTTPALLAAVYAALGYIESNKVKAGTTDWLMLLGAFDVIYLTLSLVLFVELLDIRGSE